MATNEIERPEDTVRRFARCLNRADSLVQDEITRVSEDDLEPALWWQFFRKKWMEGVLTAREVHKRKLIEITNAINGFDEP